MAVTLSPPPASDRSSGSPPPSPQRQEALLAAYTEVCKSYNALDDFRAKLLGLLPLTALGGILLIAKEDLRLVGTQELVGFASMFAAAFTLALFVYEIRGILRCHELIHKGHVIEEELGVDGQFFVCRLQHDLGRQGQKERLFNAKVAASVIYSLVFAAWLFLALRFGIGLELFGCGVLAIAAGAALGLGTYMLVDRMIAA
jgi:hypothetical protein